eukprot:10230674-Alexandrium_andersonii.AAC.1
MDHALHLFISGGENGDVVGKQPNRHAADARKGSRVLFAQTESQPPSPPGSNEVPEGIVL